MNEFMPDVPAAGKKLEARVLSKIRIASPHIMAAECKKLIGHCWLTFSHPYPEDGSEEKPRERTCQHCGQKETERTEWDAVYD